jgi:tripartite-type tricarboxylate transporter receptor subunit TctC
MFSSPVRQFGAIIFVCFTTALWTQLVCGASLAQGYPSKPVRLIVPAAAGGPTDVVARSITPKLAESLGQPVLVDNRGGVGGIIGTDIVAKAPPDGHTIAMVFISYVTNPTLVAKLPYDTLKDFAPVTLIGYQTTVLVVHPSLPVNSVKELIALAKARPGTLSYAGDTASAAYLAGELFKYMTGTSIVHVPYKGNAPALTDTLAGHVPFMFSGTLSSLPYVKAGRLKALAVTSAQRSPLAPELPTLIESGLPGFEVSPWYGVVAPVRTPKEVIGSLNSEIVKVLRTPDVKERFSSQGVELIGSTPEEFDTYIRREIAKWEKVLKAAGIRAN